MKTAWSAMCWLAFAPASWALQISDVQSSHLRFDPRGREEVKIGFVLDEPASVVLRWFDSADRLVAASGAHSFDAGNHVMAWDGRAEVSGEPVPTDAYVFVLEATGSTGETVVHDLSDRTGGQALRAFDIRWDTEAKLISYSLPVPARVSIRVGLKGNGPLLATVLDGVPRERGVDTVSWNGQDASGVLDLAHHPDLEIIVEASSLSANTVIAGARTHEGHLPRVPMGQGTGRRRDSSSRLAHDELHRSQVRGGDVAVSLRTVTTSRETVGGQIPLRLDVEAHDRQRILATRFEPAFFVDGILAFENEVGFLPTTWVWDTTTVKNGWHHVTVNVRGYEGNIGMATLKLKVENRPASARSIGDSFR